MTATREAQLSGERVPGAVPLIMAAFGLVAAVASTQLVVAAADGADAGAGGDRLTELRSSSPAGTAEPSPSPGTATTTAGDGEPAGGQPAGDAANGSAPGPGADDQASTTAPEQLDCPPLFNVLFPVGSAVPIQDLGDEASALASWMAVNPAAQLLIDGHADAAGSEQANLQLSFRRAEATVGLLVAEGVDASRLQSRGFGEYQPIVGEPPDSERNRRVTMQVVGYESCLPDDKDLTS